MILLAQMKAAAVALKYQIVHLKAHPPPVPRTMENWLQTQKGAPKPPKGGGKGKLSLENGSIEKKRELQSASSAIAQKSAITQAIVAIGDLALETAQGNRFVKGGLLLCTHLVPPVSVLEKPI